MKHFAIILAVVFALLYTFTLGHDLGLRQAEPVTVIECYKQTTKHEGFLHRISCPTLEKKDE